MPTVSTRYDIVSLFERYTNIQTTGKSTVYGVLEVHSNCPWCPGSKDSFIMRPETGQYTHMVRGGCTAHGDCIDLLMDTDVGPGMTRSEAMQELGLTDVQFADEKPATRHENSTAIAPPVKWQESAELFVGLAERNLWRTEKGRDALDYLHNRGLNDETIKKAHLGYVPLNQGGEWYRNGFEEWGLDPELLTEDQRKKGYIRIPNGIMIPWFVGGKIWKLAVKRPGEKMDYGQVMGSVDTLYNVDSIQYGEIAMMVEGELDALSVLQEAGDLVNVCATGSTAKGRNPKWITELMSTPSCVLQSFDSDKAGDEAAETWIDLLMAIPDSKIGTDTFAHLADFKVERWPLVLWKDPNELLQEQNKNNTNGFTLREWVQLGVDLAQHDMQQDMNPLAREVQEEVEVQFDPFEDGSPPDADVPPLPDDVQFTAGQSEGASPLLDAYEESRVDGLVFFAESVSRFVDELGGPGHVVITKHDGRTLEQTYPTVIRPYVPRTLPALPRTACPHTSVVYSSVDARGVSKYVSSAPCKGKPLANGWCAEHAHSQVLLEIGAKLRYPEILKLGKFGGRGILSGIACWEVTAEKLTPEHAEQDVRAIKARFGI